MTRNEPNLTVQPLSPLRKVIAARMTEAMRTIPHFRLLVDLEVNSLLRLRQQVNAQHPEEKVSINDCLIKACAWALMKHPAVNVQLVGENIHQYQQADIAVVIAVTGGLATPIVRNAERKSVEQIAAEIKELSARAAVGKLKRGEIEGGTFTISNLGMYGVDQFDAIINAPQCAILAVGRTRPRTTVSSIGEVHIATVLSVTLSVDHRVIDGATGAQFLSTLRQAVEQPQGWFGL